LGQDCNEVSSAICSNIDSLLGAWQTGKQTNKLQPNQAKSSSLPTGNMCSHVATTTTATAAAAITKTTGQLLGYSNCAQA